MYKALQSGWQPPLEVSEQEYKEIKFQEPSALRSFIGFGASFSGKFFGGYARNGRGDDYVKNAYNSLEPKIGRNYALNAANSLKKKMRANKFFETKFECIDFLTHDWSEKHGVYYLDPPYFGTTGYTHKFDNKLFWEKVRELSKNNIVICSEYKAPNDFECVLEIPTKTDMRTKNGQEVRIEKLFRLRS
jgi:DNA adenine methylase